MAERRSPSTETSEKSRNLINNALIISTAAIALAACGGSQGNGNNAGNQPQPGSKVEQAYKDGWKR